MRALNRAVKKSATRNATSIDKLERCPSSPGATAIAGMRMNEGNGPKYVYHLLPVRNASTPSRSCGMSQRRSSSRFAWTS